MAKPSTFHYFAYGSNLCRHRLALSAPSLRNVGIGRLQGYTLEFAYYSTKWNGGAATVTESKTASDYVCGIIWEIDKNHLPALDKQEGVAQQVYRPLEVVARTPNGDNINCRTYQLTDLGGKHQYADPSPQYHGLILNGAKKNGFPPDYIEMLKNVTTNGNSVITEVMKKVREMEEAMPGVDVDNVIPE